MKKIPEKFKEKEANSSSKNKKNTKEKLNKFLTGALIAGILGSSVTGFSQEKEKGKEKKISISKIKLSEWESLFQFLKNDLVSLWNIQNAKELRDFILEDEMFKKYFQRFFDETKEDEKKMDPELESFKSLLLSLEKKTTKESAKEIKKWVLLPENKDISGIAFFLVQRFASSPEAKDILKSAGIHFPYMAFRFYEQYKSKIKNPTEVLKFVAQKARDDSEISRYINPDERIIPSLSEKERTSIQKIIEEKRKKEEALLPALKKEALQDPQAFLEKKIETISPSATGEICMEILLKTGLKFVEQDSTDKHWKSDKKEIEKFKNTSFQKRWEFDWVTRRMDVYASNGEDILFFLKYYIDLPSKKEVKDYNGPYYEEEYPKELKEISEKILSQWEKYETSPEAVNILKIAAKFAPKKAIEIFPEINKKEELVASEVMENAFSTYEDSELHFPILKKYIEEQKFDEKTEYQLQSILYLKKNFPFIYYRNDPQKIKTVTEQISYILNNYEKTPTHFRKTIRKLMVSDDLICPFIYFSNKDFPEKFNLIKKIIINLPVPTGWSDDKLGEVLQKIYEPTEEWKSLVKEWILADNPAKYKIERALKNAPDEIKDEILKEYNELTEKYKDLFVQNELGWSALEFAKDPALSLFSKIDSLLEQPWIPFEKDKWGMIKEEEKARQTIQWKMMISRNLYLQGIKEEEITKEKIKEEIQKVQSIKEKYGDLDIFKNRNIIILLNGERYYFKTKKESYGPKRFGKKALVEKIKEKQEKGSLSVLEPQATAESLKKTNDSFLDQIKNTQGPLTIVMNGHGNDSSFAIESYRKAFSPEDPYPISEVYDNALIEVQELADALIKRNKNFEKDEKVILVISACLSHTYGRILYEILKKENCPLPIIITEGEYGEVGYSDPRSELGGSFFSNFLNLWDKTPVTIKMLLQNETKRWGLERGSNPSIYIPTEDNIPQQIVQKNSEEIFEKYLTKYFLHEILKRYEKIPKEIREDDFALDLLIEHIKTAKKVQENISPNLSFGEIIKNIKTDFTSYAEKHSEMILATIVESEEFKMYENSQNKIH